MGTNEHLLYGERPITEGNVHVVLIQGFSFQPAVLRVKLGDTIKFTNLDGTSHDVVPRKDSPFQFFPSPVLKQGESFTLTVHQNLDIDIFCSIHPGMSGLEVLTED